MYAIRSYYGVRQDAFGEPDISSNDGIMPNDRITAEDGTSCINDHVIFDGLAGVAELADARDLKSLDPDTGRAGSTPAPGNPRLDEPPHDGLVVLCRHVTFHEGTLGDASLRNNFV